MRIATTSQLAAKLAVVLTIAVCSTSLLRAEDVDLLINNLASESWDEWTMARRFLAELPAEDVLPALTEALGDDDVERRRGAVSVLGQISKRDGTVYAPLIAALQNNREQVRVTATYWCSMMESFPAEVAPALVRALKDDNVTVRAGAATALMKTQGEPSEQVQRGLRVAMNDPDWAVRHNAALALWRRTGNASQSVNTFIANLKIDERSSQVAALFILKEIGPRASAALPAIAELAKSDDRGIRKRAAEAAGSIGDRPEVIALLKRLQEDDNKDVRNAASSALRAARENKPDANSVQPRSGDKRGTTY